MAERVAVDRIHVRPKGLRARGSTVMVHGCEPNCPALFLRIFNLFSCNTRVTDALDDAEVRRQRRDVADAVEGGALVPASCYQSLLDWSFRPKDCVSRQVDVKIRS